MSDTHLCIAFFCSYPLIRNVNYFVLHIIIRKKIIIIVFVMVGKKKSIIFARQMSM